MPNVHGFSPLQWTLGYTPNVPGMLIEEHITPAQLIPSEAFRQKMDYQALATSTVDRASNCDRLRRALLRQYRGPTQQLQLGQRCYYYRDLPTQQAALGPKIVWRGPAIVVMVEESNKMYWLVHGTSLIRAAYEHTRPVVANADAPSSSSGGKLQEAKQALQQGRGRGISQAQYLDLSRTKRKIEEMQSDEEDQQLDDVEDTDKASHGFPHLTHGTKRPLHEVSDDEEN